MLENGSYEDSEGLMPALTTVKKREKYRQTVRFAIKTL